MGYQPTNNDTQPKLTYYGYTFPQSFVETSLSQEFLLSPDGRVVAGTRSMVRAKGRLYEGANTNFSAEFIRSQLSEAGKPLRYENQGNGDLIVNSPGTTGNRRDLEFGPKPKLLKWTRVGYNFAHDFEWECETVTSDCNAEDVFGLVRYKKTEITYSKDRLGYITRRYSGELRIVTGPDTPGGLTVTRFADDPVYKEIWWIGPINGFCRTKDELTCEGDKSVCKFSYEDVEIPAGSLPKGVIKWTPVHESQTPRLTSGLSGRFSSRMSAAYTMDRKLSDPIGQAMANFFAWVKSRQPAGLPGFVLGAFAVRDNPETLEYFFSLQYAFTGKLESILASAGHGKAVPFDGNTPTPDWNKWRQSTPQINYPIHTNSDDASSPTRAQLRFRITDDTLLDLCQGTQPSNAGPPPDDVDSFVVDGGGSESSTAEVPSFDSPEDGYLQYDPEVFYSTDMGMSVHALAPTAGSGSQAGGGAPASLASTFGADLSTSNAYPTKSDDPNMQDAIASTTPVPLAGSTDQDVVVQKRRGSITYVALSISALRVGSAIPVPQLRMAGGVALTPLRSDFAPTVKWLPGRLPVYGLAGAAIYVCMSAPGTPDPVLPPILGLGGGGVGGGNPPGTGNVPPGSSTPEGEAD